MITPNKLIPFDNSVLARVVPILQAGPTNVRIRDLYRSVGGKFESLDQFLLALDVLYVLGRIDVNFSTEEITYAERN